MQQTLNYPVKYAVMELIDKGKNEESTAFYLPAKCYVINSEVEYTKEGKVIEEHKVLFPVDTILAYASSIYYRYKSEMLGGKYSSLSELSGYFSPVNSVDKLYDDYDSAAYAADKKNEAMKLQALSDVEWSDKNWYTNCSNILHQHGKRILICREVENIVDKYTKEMTVTTDSITKTREK